MNLRQRTIFAIALSLIGPIEILLAVFLTDLETSNRALTILISLLAPLPLAAVIYFLSFNIWLINNQKFQEYQEPNSFLTTEQRILLALIISIVCPLEMLLANGLDLLITDNPSIWELIPSSIVMAACIYCLSFKIWEKQEASDNGIPITVISLNNKQRILLTLIITYIFPIVIFLGSILGILIGDYLVFWTLLPISIICAIGVYFLSFKVWKQED